MQLSPDFGHKNDFSYVSLRFSGSFDRACHFDLLFSFAILRAFQFLRFYTFDFDLTGRLLFNHLNRLVFDNQGLCFLTLNLLLKVEEAMLNFIVCLLFAARSRFFLVIWATTGSTATIHEASGSWQANITCNARTFRMVWVWIKSLCQVKVFIVHGEEFKAGGCNRLEGFRAKFYNRLLKLCVLFENLLVLFGERVWLKDNISLIERVYFDAAEAFWFNNGIKLGQVKFPIISAQAFGGQVEKNFAKSNFLIFNLELRDIDVKWTGKTFLVGNNELPTDFLSLWKGSFSLMLITTTHIFLVFVIPDQMKQSD